LSLGYHTINIFGCSLNISIPKLQAKGDISSAFSKDYFCILYACNTGTDKNGTSFAQEWANATGGYVIGLAGTPNELSPNNAKTNYKNINKGRHYEWFSPEWNDFWLDSLFHKDGSWFYPEMSQDHPGEWNLYVPNASPINADSIMNNETRKTNLPTLQDITLLTFNHNMK